MIKRIKIYGAGSIGNHLAHASRQLGWDVVVCDTNNAALERMKNEIYPSRYGKWDESIKLFKNDQAPKGGMDLIIIGTPPEFHIPLGMEALKESPKGILIEKPLASPMLEGCDDLAKAAKGSSTKVFVGYTHVVGKAMKKTEEILKSGVIGNVHTIDVEFREHWEGIFKAHPWLKGPQDTYLGYWKKGGGASGEHSHAINLWQHLSQFLGKGRVSRVTGSLTYKKENGADYDDLCLLNLQTDKGFLGRVVQDVVTRPSRKWARVQGEKGAVEWIANLDATGDAVLVYIGTELKETIRIPKTRPEDFIEELKDVSESILNGKESGLALERGLDTMMVLAAAHMSASNNSAIEINPSLGYTSEALGSHNI